MQLVSVVVGTYNGSKYIETQLLSILNQSHPNLEIIVVDDASNDNTVALLNELSQKYKNVQVHAFSDNLGYIKNFERGMALATGDLIALSDQDDWWHASKIETLVKHMNSSDLIYCDSTFVDENLEDTGNSFSKSKHMIDSKNPLNFLIDNCVSGHAMLFKKSLFDKATPFPPLIPHDWWLAYWATMGHGLKYYDKSFIKYRHHGTNVIAATKHKKTKSDKMLERKNRLDYFYEASKNANNIHQETILRFKNAYHDFSFTTNLKRVVLFYKNRSEVLKILKKSEFKKKVFCLNMFFKLK
jgi:glycosyltransferase involved in cell wall biosynthesis